jgi:DNA replication and repair protein RecF
VAFIKKLTLTNFRCYKHVSLDSLPSGLICLYGLNGSGKTNLLEAVSYLCPGRGMRNARMSDVLLNTAQSEGTWSVSALVNSKYGDTRIGTGTQLDKKRRIVKINAETVSSQTMLSEYLSCIWLTPQMDRIFMEGASERRRFLDRLIFSFDFSHSGRLARYESAMRQRSKILKDNDVKFDMTWLNALEENMSRTGVAISAARLEFIDKLQHVCNLMPDNGFPKVDVYLTGAIEELLLQRPAVEVEELFRYQLEKTREKDSLIGGASTGPHKSDLNVIYKEKSAHASQCSTGEQKALLINLILAHTKLVCEEIEIPPILLLDEVSAHLDQERRALLYEILEGYGCQVWLTGTDKHLFDNISNTAAFYEIDKSQVTLDEKNQAA